MYLFSLLSSKILMPFSQNVIRFVVTYRTSQPQMDDKIYGMVTMLTFMIQSFSKLGKKFTPDLLLV